VDSDKLLPKHSGVPLSILHDIATLLNSLASNHICTCTYLLAQLYSLQDIHSHLSSQAYNAIGFGIDTSCYEHFNLNKIIINMNNQIRQIPGYYYGEFFAAQLCFCQRLITLKPPR